MENKTKIAVFVSGGGTNLQALIDAEKDGKLISGEIELVISDNQDAYALKRAEANGIKTAVITKKKGEQSKFEEELTAVLEQNRIEMIVLAGFMCILSADFTLKWPRRIINIHPSLIPSFCGKGCYGLHVHEKALEYGVKVSGATIHFVNEKADAGAIILQGAVDVANDETPESLQKKIMENVEWKLLPKAVSLFCEDRISIKDGKAYVDLKD